MTIKEFIKRLQNLPEKKRKIIFWSVIIIIGLSLFILYIKTVNQRIKNFSGEKFIQELKTPPLKEEFKSIPNFQMKENIEELGKILKESEQK